MLLPNPDIDERALTDLVAGSHADLIARGCTSADMDEKQASRYR